MINQNNVNILNPFYNSLPPDELTSRLGSKNFPQDLRRIIAIYLHPFLPDVIENIEKAGFQGLALAKELFGTPDEAKNQKELSHRATLLLTCRIAPEHHDRIANKFKPIEINLNVIIFSPDDQEFRKQIKSLRKIRASRVRKMSALCRRVRGNSIRVGLSGQELDEKIVQARDKLTKIMTSKLEAEFCRSQLTLVRYQICTAFAEAVFSELIPKECPLLGGDHPGFSIERANFGIDRNADLPCLDVLRGLSSPIVRARDRAHAIDFLLFAVRVNGRCRTWVLEKREVIINLNWCPDECLSSDHGLYRLIGPMCICCGSSERSHNDINFLRYLLKHNTSEGCPHNLFHDRFTCVELIDPNTCKPLAPNWG